MNDRELIEWAEENGQELRETETPCGRVFPTREMASEHMDGCRACRWEYESDRADSARSSGEV